MIIQLNADKNLTIHEEYRNKLESLLTEELSRYSDHITRLEVHLSDENGSKSGVNDKRCLLEARLAGRKPIAVIDIANTHDLSVIGAISKLKPSLETIFGRLRSH
ncbi:HPF/RaiA family ribosome-associated protein [Aurantibacillus circumpalustris]|uniref:HPF/RaiA family ribosome-associated protein n=1 Tax=Aurantibacillus circumpalustris TaxID=3036359 RepID=UPI00295AEDD2|nr:HPF/RaiA family ribosome-associated protein [Aurantibacillus circumpalustris]